MYDYTQRIGFSHTDNKRVMTIEAMIDCFQDCSCFQAEKLGIGFEYLESGGLVWILNYWQIEVKRYPRFYEKIKVATYPYDFKGFFGYRNFFIEDEAGEKIVMANSVWTLMNWEKKCPAKLPQKLLETYVKEERLPMEYGTRKIMLPGEGEWELTREEALQIKKHHLDSNQHVNNGQYIRIACEYLPVDFKISTLKVEYRKQAVLDDMVYPLIYRNESVYKIALCDAQDVPYAVAEVR